MLSISPFTYGLVIEKIYDDGSILDPEILDITDDQIRETFMKVCWLHIYVLFNKSSIKYVFDSSLLFQWIILEISCLTDCKVG